MKQLTSLIFLSFITLSYSKLPPSVPVCRRSHPNLSQCIANSIDTLRPNFASGDFGGGVRVPKLEPLVVNEFDYGGGEGIAVRLSSVNIHGMSGMKIDKLRANINDLKFDILATIPKSSITAKYNMAFRFLGNDLNTNGDFFIAYDTMKILIPIRLRRVFKNGQELVKIDPIVVQILQYKVSKINFTNLFGGNKAIEDVIYTILLNNSGFSSQSKNVRATFERTLSKAFTEVADKILESVTLDEMFPN